MHNNPLQNACFRKLFLAQVTALVGTGMSTVALTLLAYDLAGAEAATILGTALAIKMVAYVVFAPVVGGLVHHFSRKPFLVSMDLIRAAMVLAIPFADQLWQLYLLIFLLNLFSAGFKPVFAATIPEILPNENQYTRALAYSRLAYDLENILSPALAALALLFANYTGLFMLNSATFLISAVLVGITTLPHQQDTQRLGSTWQQVTFGIRAYLKTPRLRGLLALYMSVAAASAMIIVNTVVYVREMLGGSESDVAIALAASGCGSMLAALSLPKLLEWITDRTIMLSGALLIIIGLASIALSPGFEAVLLVWFLIGVGWSMIQTPAGRVVNRSSSPTDRSAYFSAQFSLSHAAWMIFYPLAGLLSTQLGIEATALLLAISILVFTGLAALLWPKYDEAILPHRHSEQLHSHLHRHDLHHDHLHEGWEGNEPHSHPHYHPQVEHVHDFVIDDHHVTWPK
ncbi:MAG: MFS transporter [Candidatus Thiodiazotropha sp. (ex Ctena orbiculata)]|nr:MFS transporter [Candidatus Thiodiazotropha taylori]